MKDAQILSAFRELTPRPVAPATSVVVQTLIFNACQAGVVLAAVRLDGIDERLFVSRRPLAAMRALLAG